MKASLSFLIVIALAIRVTAQFPPNLWPNPTLEADSNGDGTPDFWTKGGGDASSAPLDIWDSNNFVSGSHSLAVVDDRVTNYGGWFSGFVAVMPGERYVLSFMRRYCASEDGMRVSARFVSSGNTFVSNVSFPVSGCQLTWEKVTAELTIPPGATKLNLEIVSGNPPELTGTNWIDDISLTASIAPSITVQPQNRAVIAGQDISFSVVAGGIPTPGYQWYFNGRPILGAVGPTFTISSAQTSQSGSYSIIVSNSAGSVVSTPATLQVFTYGYQFTIEKLWDFSGEYAVDTDESDRTTTLLHTPSGLVSGTYSEALTNSTQGMEGTGAITGRVLTTPTGIVMLNKVILFMNGRYLDDGASLHYEANLKGNYHFGGNSLIASFTGRVCFTRYGQTDCRRGTIPSSLDIQPNMDGTWQLALSINGDSRLSGNAIATLSNGRTVFFSCAGTKNRTGTSRVRLTGIGDAVGAKLLVTLDSGGGLRKMTGKVFGQNILVLR